MTGRTPVETTNLDRYGNPALPWERARDLLASQETLTKGWFSLGTVDADGRPHAAGIGAIWFDDGLWFTSGPGTRKSRNLAVNPACTMAANLQGLDLVFEGDAHRETDRTTIEQLAARYREGGWPAELDADGDALTAPYSAPSAGPPPWYLYRLNFHTVYGVGMNGATRWRVA